MILNFIFRASPEDFLSRLADNFERRQQETTTEKVENEQDRKSQAGAPRAASTSSLLAEKVRVKSRFSSLYICYHCNSSFQSLNDIVKLELLRNESPDEISRVSSTKSSGLHAIVVEELRVSSRGVQDRCLMSLSEAS